MRRFFVILVLFYCSVAQAYTFEVFSPFTIGQVIIEQISGKRFILDENLSFTDSGMESRDTDSGSYDRFIGNQLVLSANYQVSPRSGFNLNVLDYLTYTKFETSGATKTLASGVENQIKLEGGGYIDVGNQLFIGAGMKYYIWSPYTLKLRNSITTVKDSYEAKNETGYYVYLVKKGSNAQGGVYYHNGKQVERNFSRTSDSLEQDLDLTQEFYVAPTLNFFVNFKLKRSNIYVEVTNQLYTMLDKTDEDEKFPLENRARVEVALSFDEITGGFIYLDSNYANQENINADTIARYTLLGRYRVAFIEAGAFFSYGSDKQSLEELNNDVRLFQFGGTVSIAI